MTSFQDGPQKDKNRRFPNKISIFAYLISHCWTSSWSRKMKVVEMTGRAGTIARFQRPSKAVRRRAVVEGRRVGATPTAARMRTTGVGVSKGGPRAARPWPAVGHDVFADWWSSVEVFGLVAVDDHHAGLVRAGSTAWVPNGSALKKNANTCRIYIHIKWCQTSKVLSTTTILCIKITFNWNNINFTLKPCLHSWFTHGFSVLHFWRAYLCFVNVGKLFQNALQCGKHMQKRDVLSDICLKPRMLQWIRINL